MDASVIGVSLDVVTKMGLITMATYIVTGYIKDLSFLAKIPTQLETFLVGLILNAIAYYSGYIAGEIFPIILQYIISSTATIGIDQIVNRVPAVKAITTSLKFDS